MFPKICIICDAAAWLPERKNHNETSKFFSVVAAKASQPVKQEGLKAQVNNQNKEINRLKLAKVTVVVQTTKPLYIGKMVCEASQVITQKYSSGSKTLCRKLDNP